jgi:type I restriction enzyme S subunit
MTMEVAESSAKYLARTAHQPSEVGPIPADWSVVPLHAIAKVTSGKRLPMGHFVGDRVTAHPYIRVTDMRIGTVALDDIKYVPDEAYPPITNYRIFKADLFISVAGTLGVVGKIPDALDGANLTENADRISEIRCDRDYLMYILLSPVIQDVIESEQTVGAQPKLALARIRKFSIPLPPTATEQRAIATALSDVDALISGLERLIAKKRDIKQAAMQQLLTGQTRLPGFSGGWEVKRLADVGDCLRGVAYRGDADLFPHDTGQTKRLLRSNNVQNATVVATDVQFVNSACVSEHQILRAGDVLICMANGSKALVGKAGYFDRDDGFEYTFGAFMGVFRCTDVAERRFVFYLFQTSRYRDYINNLLAGSSINNLTPASVMSLEFSLPEKAEQTAIATVLSDMDAELSAVESHLAKTRAIKQGMMQELLTGRTRLV